MGKLTAPEIEVEVQAGQLQLPPLDVDARRFQKQGTVQLRGPVDSDPVSLRIVPVPNASPKGLRAAVAAAREEQPGPYLLVAAYLDQEKLNYLLEQRVSGMDLCGNGSVWLGKSLYYRTGEPNRFPEGRGIQSAYRGDSSLVARMLLLEPTFDAVGAILEQIEARGGTLSLGTVSKVLKRMEEDLVIERPSPRSVRVIQPDRLLDNLLEGYEPAKIQTVWEGQVAVKSEVLHSTLAKLADKGQLVRTGDNSAGAYATYAGEPLVACYCQVAPQDVLRAMGGEAKATRVMPNLRLLQTQDQRVYFDRRSEALASPVQVWLELASGDKRQREVALQVRENLIEEVGAHA